MGVFCSWVELVATAVDTSVEEPSDDGVEFQPRKDHKDSVDLKTKQSKSKS